MQTLLVTQFWLLGCGFPPKRKLAFFTFFFFGPCLKILQTCGLTEDSQILQWISAFCVLQYVSVEDDPTSHRRVAGK